MEYPAQGASFEEMANILHKEVVQQRFTPPVLVAHSLSTFVAQKYLESYALSGLILVNPIPPSAGPAIAALNSKWQRSLQTSHRDLAGCDVSDQRRDTLLCYYGLRGPVSRSGRTAEDTVIEYSNDVATSTSQPFFTTDCAFNALLAEESTEDTTVNLERGTYGAFHKNVYAAHCSVIVIICSNRRRADLGGHIRRRPKRLQCAGAGGSAAAARSDRGGGGALLFAD